MIPEERAARIVHRLLAPDCSWEQFERRLVNQGHPEWNQAVAFVADQIREAVASLKSENALLLDQLTVELKQGFEVLEQDILAIGDRLNDTSREVEHGIYETNR